MSNYSKRSSKSYTSPSTGTKSSSYSSSKSSTKSSKSQWDANPLSQLSKFPGHSGYLTLQQMEQQNNLDKSKLSSQVSSTLGMISDGVVEDPRKRSKKHKK